MLEFDIEDLIVPQSDEKKFYSMFKKSISTTFNNLDSEEADININVYPSNIPEDKIMEHSFLSVLNVAKTKLTYTEVSSLSRASFVYPELDIKTIYIPVGQISVNNSNESYSFINLNDETTIVSNSISEIKVLFTICFVLALFISLYFI